MPGVSSRKTSRHLWQVSPMLGGWVSTRLKQISKSVKLEKSEPPIFGMKIWKNVWVATNQKIFFYTSHLPLQTLQWNTSMLKSFLKIKQFQTWWIHQYPIQPFKNSRIGCLTKHIILHAAENTPPSLAEQVACKACNYDKIWLYVPTKVKDKNYWHSTVCLFGGWTNLSEKYARHIGSFPQNTDENKYLKQLPSCYFLRTLLTSYL